MEFQGLKLDYYPTMFEIENLLRVSMHTILVKKKGVNYFNEKILSKFEYEIQGKVEQIDFVNKILTKKLEEPKYKSFEKFEYPHLWYSEFSLLIILLDHYWQDIFSDIFRSPRNNYKTIIQKGFDLIPIRNAIAHNRFLHSMELDSVRTYHQFLKNTIVPEYITNYNILVYNKIPDLKIQLKQLLDNVLTTIYDRSIIPRAKIKELKVVYSALGDFDSEFEEITEILQTYNNKIPQKPGSSELIDNIISDLNILTKITKWQKS
jgi:hypothetical protein